MRSAAGIIARNSIVVLISKLLVKLISFAFIILIARTLGDVGFGRYALIWSYVATFATLSDFGLGTYIIRELAREQENVPYLAGNVIAFRLVLALITSFFIVISTFMIGYATDLSAQIFLASSILLLYAVQDPLDSVMQAKERADLASILRVVGQLAFVGLGVLFLFVLNWGVTGLIIAALNNTLISTFLLWYLVRKYLGGIAWKLQPWLWFRLLLVSLPFGVIGFAINWSQKIDTVILSLYWPEEVIGWYNAAYNLILGMVVISNSFNVALYPTMSKESANDYGALIPMFRPVFKYLFIISLPLAVGFSILSKPIILTLYGASFAPAILPLTILAWVLPLIFVSEFLRYTALVIGREKMAAWVIIILSVGNIFFNVLFIPTYGLMAAALITVLTEAILVGLYLWQLRSEVGLLTIMSVLWRPGLAALLLLGMLQLIGYVHFTLTIILGAATYIGILLLLGGLGAEELVILRKVFGRTLPPITSHQL